MTFPTTNIPKVDPKRPRLLIPVLNDVFSKVEQEAGTQLSKFSLGSHQLPKPESPEKIRLLKITEETAEERTGGYRTGYETYYDDTNKKFVALTGTHRVIPQPFPLARNQLIQCRWNSQAGAYVPLENTFVRIRLAQDHPGRNTIFKVHVGWWNPATHRFNFDETLDMENAIDPFCGLSDDPTEGAEGFAMRYPSDFYGSILVVFDLDCESCHTESESSESSGLSSSSSVVV